MSMAHIHRMQALVSMQFPWHSLAWDCFKAGGNAKVAKVLAFASFELQA